MLGFLFRSIGSLASFVFPVLASYKALEHDDITLLRPWLIYWLIVAVQLTVEAYGGLLLHLIPLYEFWRLLFTLWLVLPQFQGASYLYFNHVQPFLRSHEQQIDEIVASGYHTIKSMGVDYLTKLGELVRNVLGNLVFGPRPDRDFFDSASTSSTGSTGSTNGLSTPPSPGPSETSSSYVDRIFSKFRIPESAYTYGSSIPNVSSLFKAFSFNIPEGLETKDDKLGYIASQRSQLLELVSSLDQQRKKIEETIAVSSDGGVVDGSAVKSGSDDFDVVASEEANGESNASTPSKPTRGWFGWR